MNRHFSIIKALLLAKGIKVARINMVTDNSCEPSCGFVIKLENDFIGQLPRSRPARENRLRKLNHFMYQVLQDYAFRIE